ncbi:histidine N-acetyltransferase-like [Scyliorhinus canicula]|uniref:histidine N-acetyltransferase-like n=1 Tax=Scyliorhinus canicula TaxID=7830 RepID=UPI0018F76FC2|nr:histidine N-acetyltransferase-like [Scyliorhinus canicula]
MLTGVPFALSGGLILIFLLCRSVKYSKSDLDFDLATEKDFRQVESLFSDETDYIPSIYHSWLRERNRVVVLAKRQGQVIGLGSALIVDDGHTAVIELLKVAASEWGNGVASLLHQRSIKLIRAMSSEVQKQSFITALKFYKGCCVLGKQLIL